MRTTFDFAPLFRSTTGFDRMLDTLESASRVTSIDTWPPYDIVRTGEDDYRISMAVAGFTECPSSDNLRLIRHFEKGGSGSSGVRV